MKINNKVKKTSIMLMTLATVNISLFNLSNTPYIYAEDSDYSMDVSPMIEDSFILKWTFEDYTTLRYITSLEVTLPPHMYNNVKRFEVITSNGKTLPEQQYPYANGNVTISLHGWGVKYMDPITVQAVNKNGSKTLIYEGYAGTQGSLHSTHTFSSWIKGRIIDLGSNGAQFVYIDGIELNLSREVYNAITDYTVTFYSRQPVTRKKPAFQNGKVKINFLEYNNGTGLPTSIPFEIQAIDSMGKTHTIFKGTTGMRA